MLTPEAKHRRRRRARSAMPLTPSTAGRIEVGEGTCDARFRHLHRSLRPRRGGLTSAGVMGAGRTRHGRFPGFPFPE
jgi:hypothetical protein